MDERNSNGMIRLQGAEIKNMEDLKYLGSTVQSTGKEVKKCVQSAWNGWRKVSGVTKEYQQEGKVYKTAVRPVMSYGLETVVLRKIQEIVGGSRE